MAQCVTQWWCTVVGAWLGPNVPSATLPLLSVLLSILTPICVFQDSLVYQQHCTTKLARLVSLKVKVAAVVPGFTDFPASHCCCLSQGVKAPCLLFSINIQGTKLQIGCKVRLLLFACYISLGTFLI